MANKLNDRNNNENSIDLITNNDFNTTDSDLEMRSQTEYSQSSVYGSDLSNYDNNSFHICQHENWDTNWDTDWDTSRELVPKKVLKFPPKTDDVLNSYKLERRLKSSENCVVFICHPITNVWHKYIAKIAINKQLLKLKKEYKNYLLLEGGEGIPKLISNHWWTEGYVCDWSTIDWGMIVIEKLCNSFSMQCRPKANHKQKLTVQRLVPIALQQISLLEYFHRKGLTHRGVKPDNFVESTDGKKIYIIDFNRSKTYLKHDNKHIEWQKDNKLPKGNILFHSLNYHNGFRRSRRDDMESLGLCWVYQLKGELPWSCLWDKRKTSAQYKREVGYKVSQTSIEDLCEGLPQSFALYLKMCRDLSFTEKPNYDEMRRLIKSSIYLNLNCNNSSDSGICV